MIHALRGGLAAAAGLLLIPLLAAAQPEQRAPNPPQRPIRARAATAPPPGVSPAVTPPAPGGPIDRSAGAEKTSVTADGLVNLDFADVELAVVIDTIAKLTGKNFVYDDRVRGRVTIISPSPIPVAQAFTVFESVLQVKGFTTVEAPGGVLKVIPIRDAKETSISTERSGLARLDSDRFVTRLIPLTYIDAEQIANTLKPLVSKEAALVAYSGTNTIILTDSASNITRILSILEAVDVETFKEELALIRLQYADATVVADQLSQLFGAEVVGGTRPSATAARVRARPQPVVPGQPQPGQSPEATRRGQLKIITDERTNSLVALASRSTLEDVRDFIRKIDVPVEGGGRIQVYYLKHADAEELADTLNSLLGGGGGGGGGGRGGAQGLQGTPQLAGQVVEAVSGVDLVTSDVATNSLVIQASPEGYQALLSVIEKLDISRPQVLVEALIMEVGLTDNRDLGFNGLVRLVNGATDITVASATGAATGGLPGAAAAAASPFLTNFLRRTFKVDGAGNPTSNGSLISGIITAGATDNSINILSAPHILTSDNEEAEILVGNNIPIITSRVQQAGTTAAPIAANDSLATSVNVERQDIGVTLRVTPQITEGNTMRLEIFQEITDINNQIQGVGNVNQVGPALSNRRIENVVVVADNETVVIGGLIGDRYQDDVTKVPWLGDIPVLGWLFKTQNKKLGKANLLVFLTPHIVRNAEDLEKQSIVKREEFRRHSRPASQPDNGALPDREIGVLGQPGPGASENPTRTAVNAIGKRYPLDRMLEIERQQAVEKSRTRAAGTAPAPSERYLVLGGVFADSGVAQATLRRLIDAGYEGNLVSSRSNGRVLLELRIGPYVNLEDAERTADALRRAYALAPQVLVQKPEDATP